MNSGVFAQMASEIYQTCQEKGWYDEERTFGDIIALVHSELSEALEEHRKGNSSTHIYYSDKGKPEGIPIELADAVIRILDYTATEGIDLEAAIRIKMRYNKTRPYRHGNKTI